MDLIIIKMPEATLLTEANEKSRWKTNDVDFLQFKSSNQYI